LKKKTNLRNKEAITTN